MKHLKLKMAASAVFTLAAATWGVHTLWAQAVGFKRVELQKHDLSTAGRETVMARGEFNAGGSVGKHTHPGEEVAYILEGELSFEIEGKPPVTLKAGDVFFVPAGTVHSAKNGSKVTTKVLSTYIVEKGKPLASFVK